MRSTCPEARPHVSQPCRQAGRGVVAKQRTMPPRCIHATQCSKAMGHSTTVSTDYQALVCYLGGAGAVEGVGLQDVSPRFKELVVDGSNDVGAGDDQQVIVALQLIRMALVPIPPKVLLTQPR